MDLNEYLQEIAVINPKKPWAIIISQIVFDCIRKYCLDLIQENELKPWDNVYELCENYIEESFKPYLGEIFQSEHYDEFTTEELCIAFLKKFLELLKETLDKKDLSSNEDVITTFLDNNIFIFFETMLSDYKDYYIFPKDYEGVLDIKAYEELRKKLFEGGKKYLYSEEIDEPVIEKEETKSITQALKKKRLGIKQTRKINISTKTFVFAKTHKNKK